MFKNQLQEYAQKASLPVPVYDITKDGPSHEPQFKASVTVHGKVYESPGFFGNLKAAEHAAAEVALAALGKTESVQLHESGLLKTLLQEYAQKCKLPLPIYSVVKTGDIHPPMFTATVEIGGVRYDGGTFKTKKESEIRAAKSALVAIHADPSFSFLNGVKDQDVAETKVESKSAVEKVTSITAAESTPQSKSKRRKLVKGGSKAMKQESPERTRLGLPADLCTAAAGNVTLQKNAGAQEQEV